MRRSLWMYSGELMIFNSIMHTIVGVVAYGGTAVGMVGDGLFNTVHATREREAAWWFFLVGVLYLSVGLLLRWIRRQGFAPPATIDWILIGLAVIGMFAAPSFGWPFIAAAGVMTLASRSAARRESLDGREGTRRGARDRH